MPIVTMGNILGDAWGWVKSNPIAVLSPQYYAMGKVISAVPGVVRSARSELSTVVSAFRPPQPVQAVSSGLTLAGEDPAGGPSSSSLPIIIGAAAAGGLLLFALTRKKRS